MSSPKMSIAMATLVLGLLTAPCPTVVSVTTKKGSNCTHLCGDNYSIPYGNSYNSTDNFSIPYPFGIGPECSLPGFSLACPTGADNTSSSLLLSLGNPSIKVLGFDDMLWFNKFSFLIPTVLTSIGYFVELAPAQNYSVHWEAPGRPFAIPGSSTMSNMSLFVVGCGFKALLTSDSGVEVGNCSVVCVGDQIMNRLPQVPCIGIGCCRIEITAPLRAFTLNISRAGQSTRPLEQVNAFITCSECYDYRPWDLESDLTGNEYPLVLIWAIPYQPNCKRAMEDKATYACASNHSVCLEAPIFGYVCSCDLANGFDGNPYVVNGCAPPPGSGSLSSNFSSTITHSLPCFLLTFLLLLLKF